MIVMDKVQKLLQAVLVARGAKVMRRDIAGSSMQWYELDGEPGAPPAVFVHGLGGAATNFFSVLPPLRKSFSRLYVPDLPGHGFTLLAPGEAPRDTLGHFAALNGFLDAVVREPAVLVGNSLGGALSIGIGLVRPQTLGLGLLSPAGAPLGGDDVTQLKEHFHLATRRDAVRMVGRMMHRRPPGTWLVARDLREAFDSPVVHGVVDQTSAGDSLDRERLRALKMPVTLVWGESDRILPRSSLDYFRDALPPGAHIEVFERCGHVPMIERPRRTVRVLARLAREAAEYRRGAVPSRRAG